MLIVRSLPLLVSGLALYDYALTLEEEVEVIWRRRLTGPSVLFMLNRAFTLFYAVFTMLRQQNWTTSSSCQAIAIPSGISQLLLYITWACFSALRVYAVGAHHYLPAILVMGLSLMPVGYLMAVNITLTQFAVYYLSSASTLCSAWTSMSTEAELRGAIAMYVCAICVDITVLLVTWRSLYFVTRKAKEARMKTPFVTTLLRDGTLHFM